MLSKRLTTRVGDMRTRKSRVLLFVLIYNLLPVLMIQELSHPNRGGIADDACCGVHMCDYCCSLRHFCHTEDYR